MPICAAKTTQLPNCCKTHVGCPEPACIINIVLEPPKKFRITSNSQFLQEAAPRLQAARKLLITANALSRLKQGSAGWNQTATYSARQRIHQSFGSEITCNVQSVPSAWAHTKLAYRPTYTPLAYSLQGCGFHTKCESTHLPSLPAAAAI